MACPMCGSSQQAGAAGPGYVGPALAPPLKFDEGDGIILGGAEVVAVRGQA
jgi:hypothetical protein